jgi:hypothetical protein
MHIATHSNTNQTFGECKSVIPRNVIDERRKLMNIQVLVWDRHTNEAGLKVNVILILLFSIQATAKTMDKFAQEKFEDAKRAIRRRK